jgi:hypothetical protein
MLTIHQKTHALVCPNIRAYDQYQIFRDTHISNMILMHFLYQSSPSLKKYQLQNLLQMFIPVLSFIDLQKIPEN